jgi:hypothetical protein
MSMLLTFGEILANADARFHEKGGYKATAFCEAGRIDLIHQSPSGRETVISSAPKQSGVAPEDVAHGLLAEEIGEARAANEYFVVTIKN